MSFSYFKNKISREKLEKKYPGIKVYETSTIQNTWYEARNPKTEEVIAESNLLHNLDKELQKVYKNK